MERVPDSVADADPRRTGRLRAWRLAAAGLLSLAASTAASEGADRPPVLLHTRLLLTPVELAGSGLTPEVEVRVAIDDRGRVTTADVLGISPAGPHDDLLRRVTEENISSWRYAPALADGRPVATTLEWTIQFQAREGLAERDVRPPPGIGSEEEREARRSRILNLSAAEQRALLDRYSKVAESYLKPSHRRRFESRRFVVISDAELADTARIMAGNLEATFGVLDGLFAPRIEPHPQRYKTVVYVYAARSSFGLLRAALGGYEWVDGLYLEPGFLALHLNHPSGDAALHLALHEACHAYAERHLGLPGLELPEWLAEGLAEYIANSRIKKGRLIPGRTLRSQAVLDHSYGVLREKTQAGATLDEVKRAAKAGKGLSVEELLLGERRAFYGSRHRLYYQTAWLFVHFLRHAEPSWSAGPFPSFLLYLAEGYPSAASLEAAYGVHPEALEEPFRAYVRRF